MAGAFLYGRESRPLAFTPQEIRFHAFQHITGRAGGIAVQAPDDLDRFAVSKQAFPLAAALAFHRLAGKMQLRRTFGGIAAAATGGKYRGGQ